MATLKDIEQVTGEVERKLSKIFGDTTSVNVFHQHVLQENINDYYNEIGMYQEDFDMNDGISVIYTLEVSYEIDKIENEPVFSKYYVDVKVNQNSLDKSKLEFSIHFGEAEIGDIDIYYLGHHYDIQDQEGYGYFLDEVVDYIKHLYKIVYTDLNNFKG